MLRKGEVEGASAQRIPKVQAKGDNSTDFQTSGSCAIFSNAVNLQFGSQATCLKRGTAWFLTQLPGLPKHRHLKLPGACWMNTEVYQRRQINQINLERKQHTCFQVNSVVASMYVQISTDTNKLTNSNCSNGFSVNTRILGKVSVLKKVLLWWPSLRIWPAFTTRFGSPINGPLFSLMYGFGVGQIWAPLQRLCVFSWGPQNRMSIESMDRLSCATWKIGTWRQILKTGGTPLELEEKSKWSSQLPGTQKSSSCNILLLKEPPIDDITADAMSLRFFRQIFIVI